MRRMVSVLAVCLVVTVASGCAFMSSAAMEKSFKELQAQMGAPTEIEYSNWNILGMIGGAKISVESEQADDD